MARAALRKIVFGLATTGLLLGCVEGGGTGAGDGGAVKTTTRKAGARDVEAPDVFQTTDSALWDGRPSLGGIWVASPEVTTPEHALMFNPANGKSVTGALFKRERDNPGPRLQLSSDAAEALGILAGQPTEIRVTALRKEEVSEPAPAAPETVAEPATEPAAAPAKGSDAAAIASAALDAVDAGKTDPAASTGNPATDAADATGAAAAVAAEGVAVAPDAPKRKTWKERRAEAKAAREAKKRAAAEAKAAAAAAAGDAAAAPEAPNATSDTVAVEPIASAPLDARTPESAADPAPARTDTKTGTKPATKPATKADTAAEASATAAATADPAPTAASGAGRPIQVASFSKEDNAKRAAEALAKIGITATPQKSEKDGKAVWGVVVTGDDALLKKIKDAGFADAYYLK